MAASRGYAGTDSPIFSFRCYCGPLTLSGTPTTLTTSSRRFVKEEAAAAGIDVFRVFDALQLDSRTCAWRWMPCIASGQICEASICYSGDILDPAKKQSMTLKYYVNLARELESMGAPYSGHQGHGGVVQSR